MQTPSKRLTEPFAQSMQKSEIFIENCLLRKTLRCKMRGLDNFRDGGKCGMCVPPLSKSAPKQTSLINCGFLPQHPQQFLLC